MARPRTYDSDQIVERAMIAFWHHGYDGCGIALLVQATGVQRQSLYNQFGDKHGLFLACLDRYRIEMDQALAPLRQPGSGLAALAAFFRAAQAVYRNPGPGACLFVITAFGPQMSDPLIRPVVEAGAAATRSALRDLVQSGQAAGTIGKGSDPETMAAYLYAALNGLSGLCQTGGSAEMEAALEIALLPLQP